MNLRRLLSGLKDPTMSLSSAWFGDMLDEYGRPDGRRPELGDWRLRFRRTGKVREMGVMTDPGVDGTESPMFAAIALEYGVDGVRMVRPPHF